MIEVVQKISLIGYGNVGTHLEKAFAEQEIEVTHIVRKPGSQANATYSAITLSSISDVPDNQLVIVCVPDDEIASVINEIPESCPIAYTSGSVSLSSLPSRKEIGVFYPLQTFSKRSDVNLFEVPFFIEANNTDFAQRLFDLAWKISRKVRFATSDERKKLHVAAVFVNNFTNHLNHLAKEYLEEQGLDFDDLRPLLSETARKLEHQLPFDAQTGPARRNDLEIIKEHLRMLNGDKKEIYSLLTKSIQRTYEQD